MPTVTDPPPPTYRLTEEQVLLRDAVRTLAEERVVPRAAEIDKTGEFPEDLRQLLDREDEAGRRAGPAQLLDGETDRQEIRPETAVFLGER